MTRAFVKRDALFLISDLRVTFARNTSWLQMERLTRDFPNLGKRPFMVWLNVYPRFSPLVASKPVDFAEIL